MDNFKITQNEIDKNNVKSAANSLKGDPEENKNVFDRLPELIAKKFNNFIEFLKTAMLTREDLQEATDNALEQAKESGEFNGKDGISATHSWNGTILTIKSASGESFADLKGEKGDDGDDGFSVYYYNIDLDSGTHTLVKSNIDTFGRNIVAGDFVISRNGFLFKVYITNETYAGLVYCADFKGYTPIKGTDYFTESDKAEIVAETVENIPTASATTKGTVKVGDGLAMTGDVLSVDASKFSWENITDRPFYDDSVVLYENNAVHFDSYGNAVRTPIEENFLVEGEEYTVEVNNGDPISVVCEKWEDDLSEGYWFYELDLDSFKFGIWEKPSGECEFVIAGELRDYTLSMKVSKISVKKLDSNLVDLGDYAQKKDIPAPYKLPVGGKSLGGVKNGGNVVINDDGTMTAPTSGGGTISWNDLTDRPFGDEYEVVLYENNSLWIDDLQMGYLGELGVDFLKEGETYEVEFNGNHYTCVCTTEEHYHGTVCAIKFGENAITQTIGRSDVFFGSTELYNENISLKISKQVVKPLDSKYLPTATADTKGAVKVGDGLLMDGDVLSVDKTKITEEVEDALAQAKNSGEFDGKDGEDGVNGFSEYYYDDIITTDDTGRYILTNGSVETFGREIQVGDFVVSLDGLMFKITDINSSYIVLEFCTYLVGENGKDGFATYKCAIEPTYVADRDYYHISPSYVATSDRTIQVNDFIIAPSGKMFAVTGVGPAITLDLFADLKGEKGEDYTLTEPDKAEIVQAVLEALPAAEGVSF